MTKEGYMQPHVSYETVERISKLTNRPIARGFEKALIIILNDYERVLKKDERSSIRVKRFG